MKKVIAIVVVFLAVIGLAGCPANKNIRSVEYTDEHGNARKMNVEVVYPAVMPAGKMPLVVMSHGIGGSPEAFDGLMNEMADKGCVVLAPQHQDYINTNGIDGPLTIDWQNFLADTIELLDFSRQTSYVNMDLVGLWVMVFDQAQTGVVDDDLLNALVKKIMYYRIVQLKAVMALAKEINLEKKLPLHNKIDLDNIVLVGHSLGGLTIAPFVMPASSDYDERVKCAIFLSPATMLYDMSEVNIPTLWMTGTVDKPWFQQSARQGYDQAAGVKEFVKILGAGHVSFAVQDSKFCEFVRSLGLGMFMSASDFTAAENRQRKCAAINGAIMDWINFWMLHEGYPDAFMQDYSDMVSEYLTTKNE